MHSFDPEIAKEVGVNAAVLYQNILWWTTKNAANKKNIRDGYVWTYNSRSAFGQLFPYLTQSQIKTAISKLIDSGLIIKGDYNAANYDRTNWYSPKVSANLLGDAIGQKSPMDCSEIANGLVENRQPIPDIKPVIKPDGKQDKIAAPPPINQTSEISDCLTQWASPGAVASFIAYRGRTKAKALTLTGAKRLAQTLKEIFNAGGDTDDALGLAEERGWTTVKADWYFREQRGGESGRGQDKPGTGMAAAFADLAADIAAGRGRRRPDPSDPDGTMLGGVDIS
jgi:hypothetical protein